MLLVILLFSFFGAMLFTNDIDGALIPIVLHQKAGQVADDWVGESDDGLCQSWQCYDAF